MNLKSTAGRLLGARLVLLISGLVAVAIATAILFAPGAFYTGYGIEIAGNPTLANELKAPMGVLLIAGLLMLGGVVRRELATTSLSVAAVIYLSYGLSRLSSMIMDGAPHSGMVSATGVELIIGAICLLTLFRVRHLDARA